VLLAEERTSWDCCRDVVTNSEATSRNGGTILKASNSAGGATTSNELVKPTEEDGFKEIRRHKWHSTNEAAPTSNKPAAETKNAPQ
jgi:hypothetical protein